MCTQVEICAKIGVNTDTFGKAIREAGYKNFKHFLDKNNAIGRASLRSAGFKKALEGDCSDTMIIWLQKNLLGMSDKVTAEHNVNIGGVLVAPPPTNAQEFNKVARDQQERLRSRDTVAELEKAISGH